MSTVLLLIATGEKYWQYADPLIQSADKFLTPHDTLLLTDCPAGFGVYQSYHENKGYPETTLKRYHLFLEHEEFIKRYDYAFYVDIDALFVKPVGQEIFSAGITATLHHGYIGQPVAHTLERNPQSAAYMKDAKVYYCGGFNGGTTEAYLRMARTIRGQVDSDSLKGITAVWHDESHLNKYLQMYPPAKVLDSTYCYPENELDRPNNAKIVCLEKAWRGGR
jgi:histo-blood group ABO system transferase